MPDLVCEKIVTLDGYTGGDTSLPYYGYDGPQFQKWLAENEKIPHRQVLGRRTYETMASLPEDFRDDGYETMANNSGFLFTRTLTSSDWPALQIVSDDVVEFIRREKQKTGSELRTAGSLSIVQQLLRAGLVDRLKLMMQPLVLPDSGAQPLFKNIPDIGFTMVSHRLLDGQTLVLEYAPSGPPPRIDK
jgi:dihydrofolate reductase